MNGLLWALPTLPLAAGAVLLVAGRRVDRAAGPAAVAVMLVTLGLAVAAACTRATVRAPLLSGLPAELSVDGLTGLLTILVSTVTVLVLTYSAAEHDPGDSRGLFFAWMLLFAGSMLVAVTAATLPVLLMGWEVMGATSWALIGYWWRDPERVRAANVAFLTTRGADLGLYLAAGAALAAHPTGSLALADLPDAAEPWRSVITAGLVAAALGKSAQLPWSFWLSRAMAGPAPVSALLHSATLVAAGAYLLLRVRPLLDASGWGGAVVAWVGALTAIVLGLVAVAQTDLKQLLAASSCAQLGFLMLAAGSGGVTGGTVQLLAHAAAKSLLFLSAGAWLTRLGTQQLTGLYGAARRFRAVGVLFTVGAFALAGLPPLSLWAAKDVLLAATLADSPALYAAGLAAGALSALYSVKALWFVWQPAPADLPAPARRYGRGGTLPPLTASALTPLALACVALGVLAFAPVRVAVARMLDAASTPAPAGWEWALSAAVALAAASAAWLWGGRPAPLPATVTVTVTGFFRDWLHLEKAAHLALVRPVFALARATARFDEQVLDAAVCGVGRATLRLAYWSNRRVEAGVACSASAVASASRSLGRLARRPQTGQLHQYLAQAVAAFTVLAVVLVLVK